MQDLEQGTSRHLEITCKRVVGSGELRDHRKMSAGDRMSLETCEAPCVAPQPGAGKFWRWGHNCGCMSNPGRLYALLL